MSSRTSSRHTLTTVPETLSPSLKYLIVSSIAARKSSALPLSLTATWGVLARSAVLGVLQQGLRCGQGGGEGGLRADLRRHWPHGTVTRSIRPRGGGRRPAVGRRWPVGSRTCSVRAHDVRLAKPTCYADHGSKQPCH